jgi:hypothetical protein
VFPVRYELGFSIPEESILLSHHYESLKSTAVKRLVQYAEGKCKIHLHSSRSIFFHDYYAVSCRFRKRSHTVVSAWQQQPQEAQHIRRTGTEHGIFYKSKAFDISATIYTAFMMYFIFINTPYFLFRVLTAVTAKIVAVWSVVLGSPEKVGHLRRTYILNSQD